MGDLQGTTLGRGIIYMGHDIDATDVTLPTGKYFCFNNHSHNPTSGAFYINCGYNSNEFDANPMTENYNMTFTFKSFKQTGDTGDTTFTVTAPGNNDVYFVRLL